MTKEYSIYIKDHSETGKDYESACEANNIKEASEIFASRINSSANDNWWEAKDLIKYIKEEDGV